MYDWTDDMPPVGSKPELEPHYRVAISAACAFLEQAMAEQRETPQWSGGLNASPKNETAQDMLAIVEAAMAGVTGDTVPAGAWRAQIITLAVRMAWVVKGAGFGDTGWEAMTKLLAKRAPQRRAAAPPVVPA
jgi:hypothetical protein